MAVDIFLKVDGIEGESQDEKHAKEIDVLAWSWGMSQSGTMHAGGGGGAGKVAVQDVSVTKYVDASSNSLMQACCKGKHIPNILLTVRKAGGEALEYIKLTMQECIVSAISTGGSGGEDRLTENVTLNFAKFKYAYTPQKQDGTADAAKECNWDIASNVAM
jgi:type VI secretion system secreted protein Hcp